jgi:hypothetical protein
MEYGCTYIVLYEHPNMYVALLLDNVCGPDLSCYFCRSMSMKFFSPTYSICYHIFIDGFGSYNAL